MTELLSIDNEKSTLDNFRVVIIKFTKDEIISPLVRIINQSFAYEVTPELLKLLKLSPCIKDEILINIASNYRPISLPSIFEKLAEQIMCNRLKSFLKYDFLYKYQFGFRENHSTSHALIE